MDVVSPPPPPPPPPPLVLLQNLDLVVIVLHTVVISIPCRVLHRHPGSHCRLTRPGSSCDPDTPPSRPERRWHWTFWLLHQFQILIIEDLSGSLTVSRVVESELGPRFLFLLFLWRHGRPYLVCAGLINLTRSSFLSLTRSDPTCSGNSVLEWYDRDLTVMVKHTWTLEDEKY